MTNEPNRKPDSKVRSAPLGESDDPRTLEYHDGLMRRLPRIQWKDSAGEHEKAIEQRVTVGGAPQADVVLQDRTVSRLHAELDPRDDGLWVRDLGSRNGSFINDVRLEQGRVPAGGTVRLGSSLLRVTYDKEPTSLPMWGSERFGPLLGQSPTMRALFARLARVAPTDSSVLIQGETGTGKELIARAIHEKSPRAQGPFIVVDCAALAENLLEAELFGHTKGAFTGAIAAREGAMEAADGGTVFLDEIGELPLSFQPKLLRVLESREVRRLGETALRKTDVRFISATHRDLRTMVNHGAFREDLYFRIAVLPVDVPPLRERATDIGLLARHLSPKGAAPLDKALIDEISQRPWLGNVRELRNFLERVHALGTDEALASVVGGLRPDRLVGDGREVPIAFDGPYRETREQWLEYFEREYFRELLARHDRNVTQAAKAAGVDRTYVYRLIRRHDL